jgi:WD domain, G-beta repeat
MPQSAGSGFRSASYSPEAELMAGAWGAGGGWIWNAITGEIVRAFAQPSVRLGRVAFAPEGAAVAATTQDGELRIWREGGSEIVINSLGMDVTMAWNSDGSSIAAGDPEGVIAVYDAVSGKRVRKFRIGPDGAGFDHAVRAMAWRPCGSAIAVADNSGHIRLWSLDTATSEELATTPSAVYSMSFSLDGHHLGVAGQSGYAAILESGTGRPMVTLVGHVDTLGATAFSRTGRIFATAGRDRAVRVWDVRTGEPKYACSGLKAQIFAVGFTSGDTQLVAADGDGSIARWDLISGGLASVVQRSAPDLQGAPVKVHEPSAPWRRMVEEIRWCDLRCGCGNSGVHIPTVLAGLLSARSGREQSGRGLEGHIEEQGMLFEVAVSVTKVLLIALEGDLPAASRRAVLSLLLDMVAGESHYSEAQNGRPDLEIECQRIVSERVAVLYRELRAETAPGGSEYASEILRYVNRAAT